MIHASTTQNMIQAFDIDATENLGNVYKIDDATGEVFYKDQELFFVAQYAHAEFVFEDIRGDRVFHCSGRVS